MSEIRKINDERMAALTPAGRMHIASVMLKEAREATAREILEEHPEIDVQLLKHLVASRMYADEPEVVSIIRKITEPLTHPYREHVRQHDEIE